MAEEGLHPYFLDRRAAYWHASLADALAVAASAGKRVFIQYGRQRCDGSRALVEKTIVKDEIAEFLREHFECFAVDADKAEPDVAAIIAGLPKQLPTPLCVYLAADGRVLHSTAGGRPAAVLLRDFTEATSKK